MSASVSKPKAPGPIGAERMYQTILAPLVTEKATMLSERGQYAFRVPLEATKTQIRQAIEGLFGVQVVAVNTLVMKGKTKRWKGKPYKRTDVKKAIVTLAEGEMIDITSGI
jgi:large subunit ribosomal protein L23